jgi:hypothetical protein
MSYCAFENTELEITQLIGMVSDAIDNDEGLNLNDYEKPAYRRLRRKMAELIKLMNTYDIYEEERGADKAE